MFILNRPRLKISTFGIDAQATSKSRTQVWRYVNEILKEGGNSKEEKLGELSKS